MRIVSSSLVQVDKDVPKGKCRRWMFWARLEDGSQKSKRFNGAYTMAKRALEDWRAGLEDMVPNADTFGAYAQGWLDYRRRGGEYTANTLATDERHVRSLSRSPLGAMRMDAIKPADCRSALEWVRDNPRKGGRLSNTTMGKHYRICRQIFHQAVDDELLARNPMAKIKDPKPDTDEVKPLPWDELMGLLDDLDALPLTAYVMAVYLIACLGLRRAEACAVMDAETHPTVLRVTQAVKESDGTLGPPKSDAGVRNLTVTPRLAAKIAQWRVHRASKGLADAPTLACNIQGGVLRPQNLYRWWREWTDGSKYEGVKLHQLRHSNLTRMARHMSSYDLMRYAGWSSLEPTRIYIHDDYESVARGVCEAWGVDMAELMGMAA